MANSRPRVLITRSPHQASELADRLRALGAEPVLIPALEIAAPTSFAALDAALAKLNSFHWLLFTSANAVEAFHRRREALQIGSPRILGAPFMPQPYRGMGGEPQLPRIAAIGASTARALQAIGLAPDPGQVLIPPQAIAESLAEALLPHARQADGSPTRFLLLRAESAREHLPETLRAAGADLTIAPAYRTIIPQDSIPALRALFQPKDQASGSPQSWAPQPALSAVEWVSLLRRGSEPPQISLDAITFTSSSSVRNLIALCEAAGVALPPRALRISIGPITSQTLREAGIPPHAESSEATVVSLAEIVVKTLEARKKP